MWPRGAPHVVISSSPHARLGYFYSNHNRHACRRVFRSAEERSSLQLRRIAKISIGLVVSFFFALNFLFLLTSTGRVRTMDEVMPDFQSESLGARGSMAVPQAIAAHLFFGKIDRFGQPQAAYLPGQAVAALPWDLAGHHLSSTLTGVPRPSRDMFNDFFTVMSSATFSALACAFAFALFLSTGMATRTAFAAAGIFALATPLFAYSGWFYSEPLAAALLVGAALALFAGGATTSVSNSRAVVAGVLLGATVWIRAPHVLIAGAILLALVLSNRERKWPAALIAGAIISLAVVLLLRRDAQLWGNPFDFGYPAYAEAGKESLKFNLPFRGLYAFSALAGKIRFSFCAANFSRNLRHLSTLETRSRARMARHSRPRRHSVFLFELLNV